MENIWDKVLKGAAAIAGGIAGLLGEWTMLMTILVAAMTLDYITGLIVAGCGRSPKTENGHLDSKVGFIGLAKKAFMMAIVLLATLLDRAIGADNMAFQTAATCYYIANEGISILENAGLMGLPVPGIIKKALDQIREKGEKDEKDEEG